MYADGNGNVTISARAGTGEVEPKADSTTQAGVTLLAGSGIVGSQMIANVKCKVFVRTTGYSSQIQVQHARWTRHLTLPLPLGSQHGVQDLQSTATRCHIQLLNIVRTIISNFNSTLPKLRSPLIRILLSPRLLHQEQEQQPDHLQPRHLPAALLVEVAVAAVMMETEVEL